MIFILINIVFLIFMTIMDIKEMSVSNILVFIYLLFNISYCIAWNREGFFINIINLIIMFLFLLLIYVISKGNIGEADVKILSIMSFAFGIIVIFEIIFIASIISIVYFFMRYVLTRINHDKRVLLSYEIPFLPSILLGFIVYVGIIHI